MAILGSQFRRFRTAFAPLPEAVGSVGAVVEQLVSGAKISGDRGFLGDEEKQLTESLATRAVSIEPRLDREGAMLAADLATKSLERSRVRVELAMKILVTIFCLAAGIIVLMTQENDALQKWASGVIGTAVGYWLA